VVATLRLDGRGALREAELTLTAIEAVTLS
jgi:hypothetical protein